jgi:hypothetical protein
MHAEPKPPANEQRDPPPAKRDVFDVRELETMAEEEAEAEWLRHPEAWHMH